MRATPTHPTLHPACHSFRSKELPMASRTSPSRCGVVRPWCCVTVVYCGSSRPLKNVLLLIPPDFHTPPCPFSSPPPPFAIFLDGWLVLRTARAGVTSLPGGRRLFSFRLLLCFVNLMAVTVILVPALFCRWRVGASGWDLLPLPPCTGCFPSSPAPRTKKQGSVF